MGYGYHLLVNYKETQPLANLVDCYWLQASQGALVVENPPAYAGDARDAGSIPGSRRSPRGRHRNPLQDACLENPIDRGAWQGGKESDMTEAS